jgi:hypothetical protein
MTAPAWKLVVEPTNDPHTFKINGHAMLTVDRDMAVCLSSMAASEPPQAEGWRIEAAASRMYGNKWNDPKDAPGPRMKDVWRNYARNALIGGAPELFPSPPVQGSGT